MATLPRFEVFASAPDADVELTTGALLIAQDLRPALDARLVYETLGELAAPLSGLELGRAPLEEQAAAMAQRLYVAGGFRGNEADYYDPKNSLLPDVLERRVGIPISLAVVYCDVASRLGLRARGVSFPGHFLVRLEPAPGGRPETPVYVDPFFGGRTLDDGRLHELLRKVAAEGDTLRPEYLEPATPRAILLRMLMNLRGIYLSRGDLARAMLVVDRIATLNPASPGAIRDRGLLSARLGAAQAAISDLSRFLELVPDAEDKDELREKISSLASKPEMWS